jgi:hypothetical protein
MQCHVRINRHLQIMCMLYDDEFVCIYYFYFYSCTLLEYLQSILHYCLIDGYSSGARTQFMLNTTDMMSSTNGGGNNASASYLSSGVGLLTNVVRATMPTMIFAQQQQYRNEVCENIDVYILMLFRHKRVSVAVIRKQTVALQQHH